MNRPHICCPQCIWEPSGNDRWRCTHDGCDTFWNTFWTVGLCPGCGYRWRDTQCLACDAFSPHEAWYRQPQQAPVPLALAELMEHAA